MSNSIVPRQTEWRSSAVLPNLGSAALNGRLAACSDRLWSDAALEYDAVFLGARMSKTVSPPTDAFRRFQAAWLEDEANHYAGFAHLYALADADADTRRAGIDAAMARRTPDFTAIEPFLADEFSICLLLAYDELMNAWAYVGEYPFYAAFESPAIDRWIRLLARDEAIHCANAIAVLRHGHRHRFGEAERLLAAIVEADTTGAPYAGTFVLDRGDDRDNAAWPRGQKAAETVLRHLSAAP